MTFNKFKSTQRMINNQCFDSVYEALNSANIQWNSENEDGENEIRVLIVICLDEKTSHSKMAFFQFKNFASCKKYIELKKNIVWSEEGNELWNGNVHVMGKSQS